MNLLLVYTSIMCMHCSAYVDTVNRAVVAAGLNNCCTVHAVDITQDPPYQVRQITKIPTVIMLEPNGAEIDRKLGYQSVVTLVDWLEWNSQSTIE